MADAKIQSVPRLLKHGSSLTNNNRELLTKPRNELTCVPSFYNFATRLPQLTSYLTENTRSRSWKNVRDDPHQLDQTADIESRD